MRVLSWMRTLVRTIEPISVRSFERTRFTGNLESDVVELEYLEGHYQI